MTIVEEIIIEEMATTHMDMDKANEIKKFIFDWAKLLGASCARAYELSHKLVEYY